MFANDVQGGHRYFRLCPGGSYSWGLSIKRNPSRY